MWAVITIILQRLSADKLQTPRTRHCCYHRRHLIATFSARPACALHALFFTIMCCVYLCLIFFFAVCSSVGLFVVFYAQLTSHGEIRISFYYCVELLLVVIIINAFCIEEIYTGSHFFK